jgi:hypothetical protein
MFPMGETRTMFALHNQGFVWFATKLYHTYVSKFAKSVVSKLFTILLAKFNKNKG